MSWIYVVSGRYRMLVVVNKDPKIWGILWLAQELLAAYKGCCCMELKNIKFTSCDGFQFEVLCSQFLFYYFFSI